MNNKLLALLQIVLFAVMIAANAMSNILPINGYNAGEISAMFPNLFVPAGFTFGIWSIIYLLLLGYVVMSGMILWRGDDKHLLMPHIKSIAMPFLITCVLNAAWILSWHYLQIMLSLIIMLWFLRTLILIYIKMQQHRSVITGLHWWTLYAPFVVYLAWICVATIANTAALLVNMQWNGFGLQEWMWSCGMIVIAFLVTAGFAYWRGELAFGLVTAWAMYGIYKGQIAANETVGYTAISVSVLCLIIAVWGFVRYSRKTPLEGII
jgi:translocator protein